MSPNFKDILDNLYDGVYFVDKERRITYWNKGAERITGLLSQDVLGTCCHHCMLRHVNEQGQLLCNAGCPLSATIEQGETVETEFFLHHANGHRVPVQVRAAPLRNEEGEVTGAVEAFSDNSTLLETRKQRDAFADLSLRDTLTQVSNRRGIKMQLQLCLDQVHRYGTSSGILLMDIDHFKSVNDSYGHDTGDAVLKMVAQTLLHNIRINDCIGRWGGEEFLLVIPEVALPQLEGLGDKLRALVSRSSIPVDGKELRVTVSGGCTLLTRDDTLDSVVKRADLLLYESKKAGRNVITSGTS